MARYGGEEFVVALEEAACGLPQRLFQLPISASVSGR